MEESNKMLLTAEGLKQLQTELEELKTVRRREVAARLQEAISYGDLSENSEYEEAKNEQAFVEGRIIELESKIKNSKVATTKGSEGGINLGSVVEVENLTDKSEAVVKYQIVGTTEVSIAEKKISNESPLGQALIGRKKGDVVSFSSPAGTFEYKILKVA